MRRFRNGGLDDHLRPKDRCARTLVERPSAGAQLLLEADAAEVVHSGSELTAFVRRCLDDADFAVARGQRAAALVASQRGSRATTAAMILDRVFGGGFRNRLPETPAKSTAG